MTDPTIGLCMIVKDEADIIVECLKSVYPVVDFMLICDTGSTDGTKETVLREFTKDHLIGIEYRGDDWEDFSTNRNRALQKMREHEMIDFVLMMDADDRLVIDDPEFDIKHFKEKLTHDVYNVKIAIGGVEYWRPALFRNSKEFFYKGVLHEFLEKLPGATVGYAWGFHIEANAAKGARSKDPEKYLKDAKVLEDALATETDPFMVARYVFYLAQSYRDSGELKKALMLYQRRTELGFWDQEIYVSFLEAGKLAAQLDFGFMSAIALFDHATRTKPDRAEALYMAALLCRRHEKYQMAVEFAQRGLERKQTPNGLFVQPWIYAYGLLDELSISSYYTGAFRLSLESCFEILMVHDLPEGYRERVARNAKFASDALWKLT